MTSPSLRPCAVELRDRFLDAATARAHGDDHFLGIGGADVVEEMIVPAGQGRELVHGLLDDSRDRQVERIARLASLEEDVRVLGAAAEDRPLGIEGPVAVGLDQFVGDHRPQVVRASVARSC